MKKIIILIALLLGAQPQADAQFFKKLGNAIDKTAKAVDKALDKAGEILDSPNQAKTQSAKNNNKAQTANTDNAVTKTIQIGSSTLTMSGDNPGTNINWMGLYRIYGSTTVSSYFQLINEAELKVTISFENDNYTLDPQGQQYWDVAANSGNRTIGPWNLEPAVKGMYSFHFQDVPASVTQMQMVHISLSSYLGENGRPYWYSFRIQDAPIKILPALTDKGIFGERQIKLGQNISSLPATFDGVYDRFTITDENDEGDIVKVIHFYLNGEETLTAVSDDKTTIGSMSVNAPVVYVKIGRGYYRCGDSINFEDEMKCERVGDYETLTYKGVWLNASEDDNNHTILHSAFIN